jgi:hypothetical protein
MNINAVHVTLNFEMELTREDILSLLMRKEMAAHPPLAAAVEAMDVATGVGQVPEPTAAAAVAEVKTSPRSHRANANKAADTNGAKPPVSLATPAPAALADPVTLAPSVKIPAEKELRSLLSQVNAIHPAKIAGVVALLKEHGGADRLNDCPTDTWPAIWNAAEAFVTAASV